MKRGNLFWGVALMILGGLFLLQNYGLLPFDIWTIFGPLLLILLGVWILASATLGHEEIAAEEASIPLEGAGRARLRLHHGAGRLVLKDGARLGELLTGTFTGGLDYRSSRAGDLQDVTLRIRDQGFPRVVMPWFWGSNARFDWEMSLSPEISLQLKISSGASEARLDLTNLQVTELRMDTGASSTEITTPANVAYTKVVIKAGAASVKIRVPEGVAARIRTSGGLMDSRVDRERFPRRDGYYLSPDYETAPRKVEIHVEVGAGSVSIR